MLDLPTVTMFAMACLALAATPGPDMLLIASRSASQGIGAGFASLAGIQLGTYGHAAATAFGLSQLFLAFPAAYDAVRLVGAAYLLYLAWQAFHACGSFAAPHDQQGYPLTVIFRQGLVTNVLNPKMALFVLALFPQFVRPENGTVALQIMLLASVLNVVGFIVNGMVIVTASRLGRSLSANGRFRRLSQRFLGTVFAGVALRLALDSRR